MNEKNCDSKTRTIAIFGGYAAAESSDAYANTRELGRRLAAAGFEVLNGGYHGTMAATSCGAKEEGGTTIGITCGADINENGKPHEPNKYLDIIHEAPSILTRIDLMMRLSGGYIALDGGTGTLCELAVVWEHVSKRFVPPRPIVLLGQDWDDLADRMQDYRTQSTKHVHRADSVDRAVEILNEHAVRGTRARNADVLERNVAQTNTINHLANLVQRFVDERDWQPFHDPKNLSASIAIEAAELMEHFQWLRSDQLDDLRRDPPKMAEIAEELADILAYTLSFATTMNIDLAAALTDKMQKNALKYPAGQYKGRFELKSDSA